MKVHDYPQMKIRLSPELKALVAKSAKKNNRTLNAEISIQLENAYKNQNVGYSLDDLREVIRKELNKK